LPWTTARRARITPYKEADLLLEGGVGSEQLLPEGPFRRKIHLGGGGFGCRRTPVIRVDAPLQHTVNFETKNKSLP